MSDTTTPTAEDLAAAMEARSEVIRNRLSSIKENNPLIGLGEDEMSKINADFAPLQDALRDAMQATIVMGGHDMSYVSTAFNGAMIGLLSALAVQPESETVNRAIAYVMSVSQGVQSCEHGPAALLTGELIVSAIVDTNKPVPKDIQERFGVGERVEPGTHVTAERVGNVVDASELFAQKGGRTIH